MLDTGDSAGGGGVAVRITWSEEAMGAQRRLCEASLAVCEGGLQDLGTQQDCGFSAQSAQAQPATLHLRPAFAPLHLEVRHGQ